mmetsp:Transcript_4728/g.5386  ORF Transcript_4728/g.5386 Transcript_4728/m.5386 type:complete len:446 (+) Transcript_4728:234-1571(+)
MALTSKIWSKPLLFCFILLAVVIPAYAEAGYDSANLCNKNIDPKDEYKCRKRRAWGGYCSDRTQCTSNETGLYIEELPVPFENALAIRRVLRCRDENIALRIGMICDSFPGYYGGYPVREILLDEEWEQYSCLAYNPSNEYCSEWESYEDSPTEYEVGVYTCDEEGKTITNVSYCSKWSSVQTERKKCEQGGVGLPDPDRPTSCQKTCCYDTGCFSCNYVPQTQQEFSIAECVEVNENGVCLIWRQEEFDQNNVVFREFEEYHCLEISDNGRYCQRWTGNIDSEEEFEVSTCECSLENAFGFCERWECYEWGLEYHFANVWYVLILFIFAAPCTLLCGTPCFEGEFKTISYTGRVFCVLVAFAINTAIWGIMIIRASGMISLLIFLGFGLPIFALLFLRAFNNDRKEGNCDRLTRTLLCKRGRPRIHVSCGPPTKTVPVAIVVNN